MKQEGEEGKEERGGKRERGEGRSVGEGQGEERKEEGGRGGREEGL